MQALELDQAAKTNRSQVRDSTRNHPFVHALVGQLGRRPRRRPRTNGPTVGAKRRLGASSSNREVSSSNRSGSYLPYP